MYQITDYSKQQAAKLGVDIKPSTIKRKKIDVFKNGKKLASIGALGMKDYPTYLKENKSLAEERRKLYKIRHAKTSKIKGSPSYFASNILW